MLEILRDTPHWVYTAFMIVTYFGLQSCFETRPLISQLLVIPGLVAVISLGLILYTYGLKLGAYGGWVVGAFGFTVITFLVTKSSAVSLRLIGDRIIIPGGLSVLTMGLAIFAVKFFFGYHTAIGAEWTLDAFFVWLDALTSGIISGFFMGRALAHSLAAKALTSTSINEAYPNDS